MVRLSFLGGAEIYDKTVPFFIGAGCRKNLQTAPPYQGKQKWEKHLISFFSKPILSGENERLDVRQAVGKIGDADSLHGSAQLTIPHQRGYSKKSGHGMILACTSAGESMCETAAGAQNIPAQFSGFSLPIPTTTDNFSNHIPVRIVDKGVDSKIEVLSMIFSSDQLPDNSPAKEDE